MEKNLSGYTTHELVSELEKREAVEAIIAEPHTGYRITVNNHQVADVGSAIILRVWD